MRIAMVTNTYLPHVGGVARSVDRFTRAYRAMGHEVLVVAPRFGGEPPGEDNVVRVPAVQNFNGSDFSLVLPIPGYLSKDLQRFQPEVVHTHHPFLLGDTAMRIAARRLVPLVFTHHTLYEHYTHYVPVDAGRLGAFVVELCTRYANGCQHVIAPSESVRQLVRERGVERPVSVVPTGVDVAQFASGDGAAARERAGIPADAFVVGHVGRLDEEKNLGVLAEAVADVLGDVPDAWFLCVGDGDSAGPMRDTFERAGVAGRVRLTGKLTGQALVDAYHAMDLFGFSSKSETQGMVLVEAMAAGVPVAALDASGVRDVVDNGRNGFLAGEESPRALADAMRRYRELDGETRAAILRNAHDTAESFSTDACARRAIAVYEQAVAAYEPNVDVASDDLAKVVTAIQEEWRLWSNRLSAASASLDLASRDERHESG
jgi:glycosyltransferase involved in cell wall biosynthesis